jgi:hypothetical protein
MATIVPQNQCIVSHGILQALRDVQSNETYNEHQNKLTHCIEYLQNEKDKHIYSTPSVVLDMNINVFNYSLKQEAEYVELFNRVCAYHEHYWNKVTKELKNCRCENTKHCLRYRSLLIKEKIDEAIDALKYFLSSPETFHAYVNKYLLRYTKITCSMNPLNT